MALHYDFADLRLLLVLLRTKSLSAAADEMHLTTSALSLRLKHLEEAFGMKLFERTGKGLLQTPACTVLAREAEKVLAQSSRLETALSPYLGGKDAPLRIFANSTGLENFLCPLMGRFLALHPDVRCSLSQQRSSLIPEAILTGEADFGLVGGPQAIPENAPAGVKVVPFVMDHHVVVCRPDHPLAVRTNVAFAETLHHRYVSLVETAPMTAAMKDRALAAGAKFEPVLQAPGFSLLIRLVVEAGLVAVVPASAVASRTDVVCCRLTDEWAARPLSFVLPAARMPHPQAEALLAFAFSPEGVALRPAEDR